MRRNFWISGIILTIFLLTRIAGLASDKDLPVIKGKKVVAIVNDEPITLDEFNRELASLREGMVGEKKAGKEVNSELLRRLINTRLIGQEARRMGLDELREIKNKVDVFSRVTLREELMEKRAKDIKVDEKEVDKVYKEYVQEWKVNSLLFEKEEGAKRMIEEIKGRKTFEELSKRFVAEKIGRGGEGRKYLRVRDIDPQIVEVVSKMDIGSVSPVIPIKSGFVILRLEDIRYPEDSEAMNQARQEALKRKKIQALKDYNSVLIKKYVKVHHEVLDRIDYESKEPGFEALLKDKRVVAEIKGENPITVGELTQSIRQQLYHGVERAVESKRINSKKVTSLDDMLYKRVFRKEALRLGLDKTEGYKSKVKGYENSVFFDVFVNKAVVPDVKLKEEEVKAYYNEHIKDYTFSEMMKINSLVFAKRDDAEGAIEKLRKGTEFLWLLANAEGQVDKNAKRLLTFGGKLLTIRDLPDGVQKTISGARAGDFRLYSSPEGYFYVLAIQDVIPSRPQPYEEVRQIISKKIFGDRLKKAVEDYADKLKAVSEVKIYLKND